MKATLKNINALWARFDPDKLPEKALLFHARLLELVGLHGWDAVRAANLDVLKMHVKELQHAIETRPELLKAGGPKAAPRHGGCPAVPSAAGVAEKDAALRLLKRCIALKSRPRTAAEVARVVKALKAALLSGRVSQPMLKEPLQRAIREQANGLSTFLRANYSLEEPDARLKVPIHPDELAELKSLVDALSPDAATVLSLAFLRMEGGNPPPRRARALMARIKRYLDDPASKRGRNWGYLRAAYAKLDRHLNEGEPLEERTLNGIRLPPRPLVATMEVRKKARRGPLKGRRK